MRRQFEIAVPTLTGPIYAIVRDPKEIATVLEAAVEEAELRR